MQNIVTQLNPAASQNNHQFATWSLKSLGIHWLDAKL